MEKAGSKLTNCPDAVLIEQAAKGNQGAFLVLYDRYKAGIAVHVGRFIPIREEAEDVVLESFQKAFSQIGTYDSEFKFSTWLYRIARNTAFDHLDKSGRASNNMPTGSIDDEAAGYSDIASMTGNPEAEVIQSQEYDKLVRAIEGLPDLYREVAKMVLLENYGYQEVAEQLELPLGTVKTRVKRAKEKIIKEMDPQEDEL